ncbi:hypothetical protein K488DRAFT_83577 [Vararia minispora EC-137]|uniref:Uncharacterized protein n=1 Tax=Vararia minispora EC-137 TaxID=1314806 RepID=A0ACB8QSN2_9AGAM|nr:hypothetical protein K488DRAFT_83577 [Vararia minispora EC-137]
MDLLTEAVASPSVFASSSTPPSALPAGPAAPQRARLPINFSAAARSVLKMYFEQNNHPDRNAREAIKQEVSQIDNIKYDSRKPSQILRQEASSNLTVIQFMPSPALAVSIGPSTSSTSAVRPQQPPAAKAQPRYSCLNMQPTDFFPINHPTPINAAQFITLYQPHMDMMAHFLAC